MIPLLKMYDDFTSSKHVSLGVTLASTAFLLYNDIRDMVWMSPTVLVIGLCAGSAFAFLANTYLVHNESVKSEGKKNSIYATLSLLNAFTRLEHFYVVDVLYYKIISNPFYNYFGYSLCGDSFFKGFKIGFSTTILASQFFEGKTSFKFKLQSPSVFELIDLKAQNITVIFDKLRLHYCTVYR